MTKAKDKQAKGMVDISEKAITRRVAKACSKIKMNKETFQALVDGQSPKGDVFEVAKVAGVMAAKSTPQVIPMCHPLEIQKVSVSFELDEQKSEVTTLAEVVSLGRTGVEMEALCAASIASLTIYDMMKWSDKAMVIESVMLLEKSGGKSGDYRRPL